MNVCSLVKPTLKKKFDHAQAKVTVLFFITLGILYFGQMNAKAPTYILLENVLVDDMEVTSEHQTKIWH